ncbi:XrtA system polysaccharide chain length determinant [Motiliproteus sp. MSK22-1]|uniref:XrtA system polysaccharide chain length determinant n=1 Tax=Motiliproteus sp. MSK22-1 TaxID=1897630 RepID=UPI0009754DAF|nr:XrtA system polysaccharide chain length determinant [Motiliproteus sp. MSK22-1]OMH25684.1 hypothetical protein BGP75_24400 [Motiliproteus sp. MSK22-1]
MQDIIEQILTYARGIWVRKWLVLIIAWLVCIIGWPIVLKMPDTYESTSQVYVDTDSLLKPLLKGIALQKDPSQQIALMVKTLLTRPNVEQIARLTDLDLKARTPEEFDELLDNLKASITIKSAGTRRRGAQNLFTISYSNSDPILAKNVVQATLSTLVENTLGDKREDSDTAQEFLDQQLAEYERRLIDSEGKLKEFKRRNIGLMPGEQGSYYTRLERTKVELRNVELELREAEIRYKSLKNQLDSETATAKSLTGSQAEGKLSSSYDSRIEQLEENLDQLKLKYTDKHPDLRETERVLKDLREKRDTELEELLAEMKSTGVNQTDIYRELKFATAEAEAAMRSLGVRAESHRNRLSELQQKIHTIPEVEAELTALNRGYEITLEKYNELLNRKESVQLSQNAEVSADSFQFRVIDPPRVPSVATGPNRILFHSAILAAGLGLGIGLVFLIGQIRPVFFDTRQLSVVTGVPVLGSVTKLHSMEVIRATRRNGLFFVVVGIGLIGMYGAIIGIQLNPELNERIINHIPDFSDKVAPYINPVISKLKSLF